MATKKKTLKSEAKSKDISIIKIQFVFPAPEAQRVFLGGDFNDWDTHAAPMKKDKKGNWKITVNLEPGKYEYRFLVDGKWENDPTCTECVPNEFGSVNCIRIVE